MLIHCPKCGVPSDVDLTDVAADGAVVRCDVCGARWNPLGGADRQPALRLHDAVPVPFDRDEIGDALVIEHVGAGFARNMPPHRRAMPKPPKDRRYLKAAGAILGAFLLSAVIGGPLISAVPGVASISGTPGSADVLSFRNVKSHTLVRDGAKTLFVEGEIVNLSFANVDLPAIHVTLRSPDGHAVASYLVEPSAHDVAAGQAVGFRSAFAAPSDEVTEVTLSLTTRERQIVGMR